jgi:hypothetical protein
MFEPRDFFVERLALLLHIRESRVHISTYSPSKSSVLSQLCLWFLANSWIASSSMLRPFTSIFYKLQILQLYTYHIPCINQMHTMFNTNKCTIIFRYSFIYKVSCNMFRPSSERYQQEHSYNYRSVWIIQFGVINSTVYIAIILPGRWCTTCSFCGHHPLKSRCTNVFP